MARHVNIPIFIPHEGCRNECVFCNQKTITGTSSSADRDITAEIDKALATVPLGTEAEIAFFGGSFTGIGIDRMTRLCDTAYSYVKQGKVQSIRLSTRPDYINEEILTLLKERGVTHIELGIQSMKLHVLDACKRGHTVYDTERACKLIKDYGFVLGGQMMVGLPCSTVDDEIYTAEKVVELGCSEARIYPCVVFYNTQLCNMAKQGEYSVLTLDDAVERSFAAYKILNDSKVKILRIGLQSSESLQDENEVYGGANHPAMGELVMSRYFYYVMTCSIEKILSSKENNYKEKTLIIECAPRDISKVLGQKKKNKEKILAQALKAGFSGIKIIQNDKIQKDKLNIYYN